MSLVEILKTENKTKLKESQPTYFIKLNIVESPYFFNSYKLEIIIKQDQYNTRYLINNDMKRPHNNNYKILKSDYCLKNLKWLLKRNNISSSGFIDNDGLYYRSC